MMGTGRTQLLLLFFNLIIFSAAGKPNEVCISQGGRFAPFSSEGKPPSKVTKGSKDLTLCRVYRKRTCCDVAQTHPALLTIRRLASVGEASQECLQLWELLECSICDPRVGVQPGPPLICASFCDRVFEACVDAYFSEDAKTQVLSPCGLNDFVCGRVSEWASNGTELCKFSGFAIKSSEYNYGAGIEPSCYGGKASLDSIADSYKTLRPGIPRRAQKLGSFQDFQQWVRQMPINERVSWAVGGMVLTAGLLFVSKRRSQGHIRTQGTFPGSGRRLDGRSSQQSSPKSSPWELCYFIEEFSSRINVFTKCSVINDFIHMKKTNFVSRNKWHLLSVKFSEIRNDLFLFFTVGLSHSVAY